MLRVLTRTMWLALTLAAWWPAPARAAVPAAPTNFLTTVLNPFALQMTWTLNTNGVTNIVIGFHDGSNASPYSNFSGSLPPTTSNFLVNYYLQPRATYQFFVQAQGPGGNANSTVNTVTMPAFDAPTNLVLTATSPTAVKLTWTDRTTNETGFLIGARAGTNGNFTGVSGSLPPNTTNYTLPGLVPGTLYQFFIQAYYQDSYATNPATSGISTITLPGLNAPTNLHATATNATSVSLNWSDVSSNEADFIVLYRPGNSGPYYLAPGGVTASNTTNFTVTGLSPVTTYQFIVETFFDTNSVADSAPISVDTLNDFTSLAFQPGVVGQPIATYTLAATTTRGPPDSFNVGGTLPPGLTFDGVSQINGTPTQAGVFTPQLIAHYPAEGFITNTLTCRVIYPNAAPVVTTPIPKQTLATSGPPTTVSLNSFFTDRDTEKAVHFVTTKGNFDLALYATAAPQTVSNFLGYVTRQDYTNSLIYRASTVGFFQDFVVQAGGYRTNGANFTRIPTPPGPTNEPGIQHVRGTIAMAKGSQPNSAGSEWFINMRDNSDQLDAQNGGFASFGRVCGGGMSIFDAIMQLPRATYTVTVDGAGHTFDDWPLDTTPPAPATMDQTKLLVVQSVTPVEPLSYAVTGNTLTNIATAAITGTNLVITPVAQLGGTTVITVTATDLDGNATPQDVTVEISSPYTTWLNSFSLTGSNSLPAANSDGDRFNNAVEFALMGSPVAADNASIKGTNSLVTVTGQQYLALTFKVRKSLGGAVVLVRSAATYNGSFATIWTSDDVANPLEFARVDHGDHWLITVRDSVAVSAAAPGRFLNLEVQTP
ncbi:MAG: fibronectin type III domain-containing protein [Verrucomicrobia bacterium]|nr:fibronectin type III domain-containing protein [Verrucomicrobiota bacterium]